MSLQVNFNGKNLVKPGAASRVVSKLQSYNVNGAKYLALIGTADSGAPGLTTFTSPEQMRAFYQSGDLADAADAAFNPSNDPRITGGPAAVLAYKLNASTQSTLALKNGSAATVVTLTSRIYGTPANKLIGAYSAGALALSYLAGLNSQAETSPTLVGSRFTLQYSGTGSAASATVACSSLTAGTLTTTVTGGPGTENLSMDLALYATVADLVAAINAHPSGKWAAVMVAGTNPNFACLGLDRATYADVKTSPTTITALVQDVIDWCNNNSGLVTAAREATGAVTGALATLANTAFTGAAAGSTPSANDWTTALNTLKAQRINALVPLISADVSGGATFAAVLASAASYASAMNSATGRNEVQVYLGQDNAKATVKASAQASLNTADVCLSFHKFRLAGADGTLKFFPSWSSALLYAAMRCSAPLGEPLTFKYVRAYGIQEPATFFGAGETLATATDELLLAGLSVFEYAPGKGYRLVKGNTTYTKTDDDAFTEESVVDVWKTIAYDLRSTLEDLYTGTKGTPASVLSIEDTVGAKLEQYRQADVIVDSSDEAGNPLHAWRGVSVMLNKDVANITVTITPVEGINYQLPTIYLAPVRLSV